MVLKINAVLDDYFMGHVLAYVPIYAMSDEFKFEVEYSGWNYDDVVRYLPLLYGTVNVLFMAVFRELGITDMFHIGFMMSIVFIVLSNLIFKDSIIFFGVQDRITSGVYMMIVYTGFYAFIGHLYYAGLKFRCQDI